MKSLILVLSLILFSCSDYQDPDSEVCEQYTDLCGDGGSDIYLVCADEYGAWYEVYGTTYYTAEYMLMMECE